MAKKRALLKEEELGQEIALVISELRTVKEEIRTSTVSWHKLKVELLACRLEKAWEDYRT